jgi:hypothetical protein
MYIKEIEINSKTQNNICNISRVAAEPVLSSIDLVGWLVGVNVIERPN